VFPSSYPAQVPDSDSPLELCRRYRDAFFARDVGRSSRWSHRTSSSRTWRPVSGWVAASTSSRSGTGASAGTPSTRPRTRRECSISRP